MPRISTLLAAVAATMLVSSMAHAADFQEGRSTSCSGLPVCTLNFAGPGPGKKLRIQHISCAVHTNAAVPHWEVRLFDGNNALYVPTVISNAARQGFVAATPVTFFTVSGPNITVQALLGASMFSHLACTISGQSS